MAVTETIYLPPANTLDEVLACLRHLRENGIPLDPGTPSVDPSLVWVKNTDGSGRYLKVAGAGGSPQEVVDARTGWFGTYSTLDERIDQVDNTTMGGTTWSISTWFSTFLPQMLVSGGGILFHMLGSNGTFTAPLAGSMLKLHRDIGNIALQTGGTSWTANSGSSGSPPFTGAFPSSITIGGVSAAITALSQVVYVPTATGGGTAWTTPGASYNQVYMQNLAWQVGRILMSLSSLVGTLRAKGVLQ